MVERYAVAGIPPECMEGVHATQASRKTLEQIPRHVLAQGRPGILNGPASPVPLAHGLEGAARSDAVPRHHDMGHSGKGLSEIGEGPILSGKNQRVDAL
jgi:hypothetical protein